MKKILAILFLTSAFFTLLALGGWQLQRLAWKNDLVAAQEKAAMLPPLDIEQLVKIPLEAQTFRRVRVEGYFLPKKMLLLGIRTQNGKAGYHAIVPLKIKSAGAFNGYHLLVNLGWLPIESAATWVAPDLLATPVEIVARVQPFSLRRSFTPDNHPEKGQWYHLDVAEIASFAGLKPFLPFSVQLEQPLEDIAAPMPQLLPQKLTLKNDHLQYAITWFSLAAALLVMVLFSALKRR